MRVLFVSSEIYPYAKTGGLGDVAAALPEALIKDGIEVVSVMPLYASVSCERFGIQKSDLRVDVTLSGHHYTFGVYQKGSVYFLDNPEFFHRETPYGNYPDNDLRFGLFAYGTMELMKLLGHFDAIHVNDWQSGLVPFLAKERYEFSGKVVCTIHNLAYQGVFHKSSVERLGIGWDHFTMHRFEFFDQVNFLKGAIAYSDYVVAASPGYAKEIQTPTFGCDLDQFLRDNSHKLRGILNGIDTEEFSPDKDQRLFVPFAKAKDPGKSENKVRLLEALGLGLPDAPLLVFIGRFAWQKGVDVLYETLHDLQELHMNIAILGEGEHHLNEAFASLKGAYPNISVTVGYDETLARRMYAAGDFLLMPSRYEPCGLNQMIAMRYGCLPIVRRTGGLNDTVCDIHERDHIAPRQGLGICMDGVDRYNMLHGVARAVSLYADKGLWQKITAYNEKVDNSWRESARAYGALYTGVKE